MNDIDWSAVIALVAIVSPIVTTLVNNKFQLRIKNFELYQTKRTIAFENYFKYVAVRLYSDEQTDVRNYNLACGELYLYVPKNLRAQIDSLDSFITDADTEFEQIKAMYRSATGAVADFYTPKTTDKCCTKCMKRCRRLSKQSKSKSFLDYFFCPTKTSK